MATDNRSVSSVPYFMLDMYERYLMDVAKLYVKNPFARPKIGEPKIAIRRAFASRYCSLSILIAVIFCGASPSFGHSDAHPKEKSVTPAQSVMKKANSNAATRKSSSRWGASYFPNIPLVSHKGEKLRFFDDLIKDKVVAINFIYTSCAESCPLETARMAEVQRVLGDRVGRDVFLYSITIDPERDTVEVLNKYAEKFQAGPGWKFLTGDKADIILLRKKLGLYIAELQQNKDDGSIDHNLSLIIGNQKTGRWMKRSPYENPYFLAKQLGSWLHNWKVPEENKTNYASAPKLRKLSMGEKLFRSRCSVCHTIGAGDITNAADRHKVGPDLIDVTENRERVWLQRWLASPEKMLEEKDPIVVKLYEQYKQILMPNMRLNKLEITSLIDYVDTESQRIHKVRAKK